ncbi:hypothetical protein PL75_01135 [Neisseria arctica]|uniref:Lipoprotein n=1 Tax=Neisseria arctica TaxID=1470200 RepID=A0A0J0YU06_9NEIS|nr:hypothetical protein [Neisseria arctica]KLT73585.1 hypothetical protein PL75_01135 [Neisseria arctica]UOO85705.1 hypothetical protein LVJ86_05545 [Neisseria arctica]
MKKTCQAIALTSVIALSGCADLALQAAINAIATTTSMNMKYGNYPQVGKAQRISDRDFRELKNSPNPELAAIAAKGDVLRIISESREFKPFTLEDFKSHRIEKRAFSIYPNGTALDYYIYATLDMKKDAELVEIGREAAAKGGIVLVRGLKNDSVDETMTAAKLITDTGAVLLMAPGIMEELKAKFSPTFAEVTVLPDGKYGCLPVKPGTKCNVYSGNTGFMRPVFGSKEATPATK